MKDLYTLLQTKETRLALCKDSLYLFGLFYFAKYFTHKSPNFHKEKCKIVQSLGSEDKPKYLVDCEFRGSAKTSWIKIDFIRRICYNDRKMMLYGSLDKKIAENALLDISIELQTNPLLIRDFGQLFYDTSQEKKSKKSGVADFLTSNGIRVQAITTGQPIRGMVYNATRPDYCVFDDFENNKTKKSTALTKQVTEFFDEMFPALAPEGIVVFLCNKISDTGSVAWLYDKFENNKDGIIFEKAVVENDIITWDDKYCFTDKEAQEINKTRQRKQLITSLESLKRTMNKDGRKVYEQEMMNEPLVDGERFFDIELIDEAIKKAKERSCEKYGNWKIWEEYNPLYEYKIAADVSEGYGIDSSVIEVLNIDTGRQAAEFESNLIGPIELAQELIEASENYGNCSITPERNNIGTAVISSIQEKGYGYLLTTQKILNSKTKKKENRYGWNTSNASKPKMLFDLQRDFNNGDLIIFSVPLLREMRAFSNGDLKVASFDEELSNHFDRVIAMAICNQTKIRKSEFAIDNKKHKIGENASPNNIEVQYLGRGKFKLKNNYI